MKYLNFLRTILIFIVMGVFMTNFVFAQEKEQKATFAGGCFWCMEQPFESLNGVVSVTAGYVGGVKENPTYVEFKSLMQEIQDVIEILIEELNLPEIEQNGSLEQERVEMQRMLLAELATEREALNQQSAEINRIVQSSKEKEIELEKQIEMNRNRQQMLEDETRNFDEIKKKMTIVGKGTDFFEQASKCKKQANIWAIILSILIGKLISIFN